MINIASTSERNFINFDGTTDVFSRATKQKVIPEIKELAGTNRISTVPEGTNDSHLVQIKPLLPPQNYRKVTKENFQILQKWQGEVLNVCDSRREFRAELVDKTNPSLPIEEAIFDFEDLSLSDLELLRPGAIFYWTIGYVTDKVGTKSKHALIRFSRLRGFTDSAILEARQKAANLLERLHGSSASPPSI